MEINKQELRQFLVAANKATYASGDATKQIKETDGSKTLVFEAGNWKYHDNYFGGEPFGGREVVFFNNLPVYLMVYYGWVNNSISDFEPIYKFLREALLLMPQENPYRGPQEYRRDDFIYLNEFNGGVDNFSGEEKILYKKQEIYSAKYIGGFIDLRK